MSDTDPKPTDPPAGPPPTVPAPPAKDDPPADPTDWKAEARKHETRAKKNATDLAAAQAAVQAEKDRVQAILKAAGLADADDPAEAAKRAVTERDTAARERDAAVAEARQLRMERAAERIARRAGANVELLMDSRAFEQALASVDPESKSLTDDLKKLVDDTLKSHPHLLSDPPPDRTVNPPSGTKPVNRDPEPGMDRLRSALSTAGRRPS